MTELVDFLKARVAEDEEYAQHRRDEAEREADEGRVTVYRWLSRGGGKLHDDPIVNLADSWRWLAEVEAKRGVIREVSEMSDSLRGRGVNVPFALTWILMHLASVYSEHPDFKADWSI